MRKAVTIENLPEVRAKSAHFREEFQKKFGHPFDPLGYHGHPFFGYNCRDCGIHISFASPKRWLAAEKHGKFPGLDLPEVADLRAGIRCP
ncbi:MAG: hypothetical protein HY313_04145 [Acidobacteria bacterium]|nr:hypothetical protein [Acidobacteriota bacterium]